MPTARLTPSRWKTYHLLSASTDTLLNDEYRLFAWSVKAVMRGLIDHADYLQRAAIASRSSTDIERRVASWALFDVNPVAELMRTAPTICSFLQRWNGYNQLAPLGVSTYVDGSVEKVLQRRSRCNDADSEFRLQMVAACINQLSPLSALRADPRRVERAKRLLTMQQLLNIRQDALTDVMELLYESPHASLNKTATMLSCSRRSLQRAFTNAAITFRELRQAVRLTTAGYHIRTTSASLTEIAHHSGFFDSAHFTRAWLQSCGITPSEYRGLLVSSASERHIKNERHS